MQKKDIVVAIPVCKTMLSADEHRSLRQAVSVLSEYTLAFVQPENLDTAELLDAYSAISSIFRFSDNYFRTLKDYNRLMLSAEFYQRFSKFRYMLVYQLDCYVFHDSLLTWAEKGYDYVGAPWIPRSWKTGWWGSVHRLFYWLARPLLQKYRSFRYALRGRVGNGGFSLRNIDFFTRITRKYGEVIANELNFPLSDTTPAFYPEDAWISVRIRQLGEPFRTPSALKAIAFAVESRPDFCLRYLSGKLPFGCHAWCTPRYKPFWTELITSE